VKGTARFDFNKAAINEEDGVKLMKEVRSMKNVTWQTISVAGHTDNLGPEPYNVKLSEKRAQAVQDFLIGKGVKPERIKTEAKGPHVPVASNKTKEGRAQNRRTEIEFVGLQSVAQN
jgi:OOP family OmpA-OmpF porin